MPTADRTPLPRAYVRLVGLTSLAVLLQAVVAGIFVDQEGHDSWVDVHGALADITWVLALITAVVAYRRVREQHRGLWRGSAALFVLTLAQTGIGHLITDGGMDGLIVVHVPLAMVIFGLTIWLAVTAARHRRSRVAVMPYDGDAARHDEPLTVSYPR